MLFLRLRKNLELKLECPASLMDISFQDMSLKYPNRKKLKKALLFCLFFALVACDSGTQWRDEKYVVIWIDTPALSLNLDVGEGASIERVAADVVAVGSNQWYVVAKQRNIKTQEFWYFYIEKSKDDSSKNADEITQGPYSEQEFIALSKQFGLPTLTKQFNH
jgi:hypothetical protein